GLAYCSSLSRHDALPTWRHFAGPGAETASETAAMTTPATEVPGLSTTAPVGDTTAPATSVVGDSPVSMVDSAPAANTTGPGTVRSEEHTSELQSRENLVC